MRNKLVNWFSFFLGMLLISPVYADPPPNDDLEGAIQITTLPYTNTQTTVDATTAESEKFPIACAFSEASVWYQYTPSSDGNVIFSTLESDYDTVLGIWTGTQHPLIEINCNDNNTENVIQAQLNTTLTKGTPYFISVAGFNQETGTLVFNANTFEPLTNDDLANAIDIGNNFPYSHAQPIAKASAESLEETSECATRSGNSVWFQYTPSVDTFLVMDTLGSGSDTVLSVWRGSNHPLTELNCNNNVDDFDTRSQLRMTFTANKTYYIKISSSETPIDDTEIPIDGVEITDNVVNDIIIFNAKPLTVVGMGIKATGDFFATNALFISRIMTDNGLLGNNLNVDKNDEVTLSAVVTVETPHVAKTADILMVAMVDNSTFFMRNGEAWEAWDFAISSLTAAEEKFLLPDVFERTVYQGSLAALPFTSYVVYVGYRLENGDVIFNGTEPIKFKMQ